MREVVLRLPKNLLLVPINYCQNVDVACSWCRFVECTDYLTVREHPMSSGAVASACSASGRPARQSERFGGWTGRCFFRLANVGGGEVGEQEEVKIGKYERNP